eukprot:3937877-Rhodomonas_salina.1
MRYAATRCAVLSWGLVRYCARAWCGTELGYGAVPAVLLLTISKIITSCTGTELGSGGLIQDAQEDAVAEIGDFEEEGEPAVDLVSVT